MPIHPGFTPSLGDMVDAVIEIGGPIHVYNNFDPMALQIDGVDNPMCSCGIQGVRVEGHHSGAGGGRG